MAVEILSASTLIGNNVVNPAGEDLGSIKEIMLDVPSGHIAYAVLSFGGFLGMGDKYFALPWSMLRLDGEKERFVLDVPKDVLKKAPGFDKDDWPEVDREYLLDIYTHYGQAPYWETRGRRRDVA